MHPLDTLPPPLAPYAFAVITLLPLTPPSQSRVDHVHPEPLCGRTAYLFHWVVNPRKLDVAKATEIISRNQRLGQAPGDRAQGRESLKP